LCNGSWSWKPASSEELVDIQCCLIEVPLGSGDKPVWTSGRKGSYVSSNTWDFLRDKKPDVDWWHLNWYSHAILKHAFVLWLAVQNGLTTGDRFLVWGFRGDTLCGFCSSRIWHSCICKGVLVWPILMFDRMCCLRVAIIGKRKSYWGFSVGSFFVLLCITFGELEIKSGFLVIPNLRSKFSNWFFGKLELESLVKESSRRQGRMVQFASSRI
jgi:hypothetical protein